MSQLRRTYGDNVRYILFLCGYFDTGYPGYEAAEGIGWVWEHLNQFPPQVMLGESRVYGGGLHKLEPRELGNVPAEALVEKFSALGQMQLWRQSELFEELIV